MFPRTPPATPRMIAGRTAVLAFIALGTVTAVGLGSVGATAADPSGSVVAEAPAGTAGANTGADADSSVAIVADAEADFAFTSVDIEIGAPGQAVPGSAVLAEAAKYVGTPYALGGSTPSSGFDCSGFTSYVYGKLGVSVPRSSADYFSFGVQIPRDQMQAGDFIVLEGHVAIYAGNGQIIDAATPGTTVQFRNNPFSDYVVVRVP